MNNFRQGFGLAEVLISTAVAAIVITTLFVFVVRSFTPPRQQYEQGRITEDARRQLNRVSDLVRNAVDVDFNGNGAIDSRSRQEQWLQYGSDYDIIFYTWRDVGGNDRLEQVRLWLENSELKMEVKAVVAGACFTTDSSLTVARSVRNIMEDIPLFSYYYFTDSKLSTPIVSARSVERVRLNLVIDTDVQQAPAAAYIRTEMKPRQGTSAITLVGNTPACSDCIDNDLDGRVDLGGVANTRSDPGCAVASDGSEKGDVQCDDGFDNDGDATIDYQEFGVGDTTCTSPSGTSEGTAAPTPTPTPSPTPPPCVPGQIPGTPECSDGVDNDCDGLFDFPADAECANSGHNNEWSSEHQCNDGIDNDGNGFFDFQGAQSDAKCASNGDKSEWQAGQQS